MRTDVFSVDGAISTAVLARCGVTMVALVWELLIRRLPHIWAQVLAPSQNELLRNVKMDACHLGAKPFAKRRSNVMRSLGGQGRANTTFVFEKKMRRRFSSAAPQQEPLLVPAH